MRWDNDRDWYLYLTGKISNPSGSIRDMPIKFVEPGVPDADVDVDGSYAG